MFRKSSHSIEGGHCLEADAWSKSSHSDSGGCLEWRTSSHSGYNGNCVELAPGILVRDSKLKDAQGGNVSPVLRFTPSAWTAFITEVRK